MLQGLVSELGVHGQSVAHPFAVQGFGFMVRVWVMCSAAHGHEGVGVGRPQDGLFLGRVWVMVCLGLGTLLYV